MKNDVFDASLTNCGTSRRVNVGMKSGFSNRGVSGIDVLKRRAARFLFACTRRQKASGDGADDQFCETHLG